jgi:6-pyruvoyl-tetrahydropterin synthase
VAVKGPVKEESGFVVDYTKLGEVVKAHVIQVVDHRHLGEGDLATDLGRGGMGDFHYSAVFGKNFYPSSENLVVAFARILSPLVQELGEPELTLGGLGVAHPASIQLVEVSLDETCTCRATWRPQ